MSAWFLDIELSTWLYVHTKDKQNRKLSVKMSQSCSWHSWSRS